MQKWDEHVVKWSDLASERGMNVDFAWWGNSELVDRLSQLEHAGRLAFWFGSPELFTDSWFNERLGEAIESAGSRYSPRLHVDLSIVQNFELFGRTNSAKVSVQQHAKDIRRACSYEIRRLATDDPSDDLPSLKSLADTCDEVIHTMSHLNCPPDQQWQVSEICQTIKEILKSVDNSDEALAEAERLRDKAIQGKEPEPARTTDPFREARYALRRLEGQLWTTLDDLSWRESFINSDVLIVTGEAGTGKTHLLCDVADNRIKEGLPTVILMGQRFLSKEDPWKQVLDQLDLSNISTDVFVGALEAAAQAADNRALVIIDAINEGAGDAIWPAHLAPFLARLQRCPWIGVVLSVRTPYLERVVIPEVLDSAQRVEHLGFGETTYEAVMRYCEQFNLEFPTTPLLRPEFDNPLFLRTLCEGLRSNGQSRFPVGAEGITQVFDKYLKGVNLEVAKLLDLDPQTATVRRALDGFAAALVERGTRWLSLDVAQTLINEHTPTSGYKNSLYWALVNNGLLMELLPGGHNCEPAVQFGFEWFADHLIAAHLIDSFGDIEGLTLELNRRDTDGFDTRRLLTPGLLDALAILLPERHRVELPDVLREPAHSWYVSRSFLKTLPWRTPESIGVRCHDLVNDAFERFERHESRQLLDALVTCATVPGHPFGAESLDNRLRQIPMPDRDAVWSTYLHHAYNQDGPVDRVLDWAEGLHTTDSTTDPESVWACAVVLTWFLTTSNRFVRDRATKGLVALLDGNFKTATRLVRRFHNVDDPYVCERLMAAAYGIAMRSTDARGMAPLAEAVYEEVFAEGHPPVHYLLRDYARGVIERALYLGAEIDVDRSKIEPPYRSDWPHIPDDTELEEIDPSDTDPPEPTSDAERDLRWIWGSVMHSDFARYIIGNNFGAVSDLWLSVSPESPLWQSFDEQLDDFLNSLDDEMLTPFQLLTQIKGKDPLTTYGALGSGWNNQAESDDRSFAFTVSPGLVALEQVEVQKLTDKQKGRYHELEALRDYGEPRLALEVIQRYVLRRVLDLGWTRERFSDFDQSIGRDLSHVTRKAERVGKKYQWIALHEILALVSDHYQLRDGYRSTQPVSEYHGPWQSYERDIDPSLLQPAAREQPLRNDVPNNLLADSDAVDWGDGDDAHDWLSREDELPDIRQLLQFTWDEDGNAWLMLHGTLTWEQPIQPTHDHLETTGRRVWVNITGYLLDRETSAATIDTLRSMDLSGQWVHEPAITWRVFFGEVGWSPAFNDLMSQVEHERTFDNMSRYRSVPTLRPAAMEYSFEGAGYDCSLSEPVTFYRPDWQTAESMRLKWTGKGADFENIAGEFVVSDPSAVDAGSPALISRESDFADYLNENGLALTWVVKGERCAFDPERPFTWDGSLRFWGVYEYTPSGPQGQLEARLDLPDDH
ncbi:MAG: hypothetical protein KTV16_14265 [Acidimicrobiia bacterium]|nr:hypothetical protein [Acidimicrobiia bacterium]